MPLFPRSGGFIDMKVLGKGENIRHLMTDLLGDRLAGFFLSMGKEGIFSSLLKACPLVASIFSMSWTLLLLFKKPCAIQVSYFPVLYNFFCKVGYILS